MKESFILTLDHGTTGLTVLLVNRHGEIISRAYAPIPSTYPHAGWVEQDPMALWSQTVSAMGGALAQAQKTWDDIAAIGLTNQRETLIAWDATTGKPFYPAIVWQCRRTRDLCDQWIAEGLGSTVRDRTGLVINPYFSATKLQWLMDNVPAVQDAAHQGTLRLGTVDTWIFWNLSGGSVYATDHTNASRTMLFDIHRLAWDPDLCQRAGVNPESLPTVHPSATLFGQSDPQWTGGRTLPLAAMVGDQQSSLYGQLCWEPGQTKCTFGTGAFLMQNLGPAPQPSSPSLPDGLLLTLACQGDGQPAYALEGAIFTAGAMIEWACNKLKLAESPIQLSEMAAQCQDSNGVFCIPAFVGLGSPHWDDSRQGASLHGLTLGTEGRHIARCLYETIVFRTREVLEAMDAGNPLSHPLHVDGGIVRSEFFLQLLADGLNRPVTRWPHVEATALGAAYLAGLTIGFWPSPNTLATLLPNTTPLAPNPKTTPALNTLFCTWHHLLAYSDQK